MSDNTKIEWATSTWNPIIGCSKVSPGCKHCYAERMAGRLSNMKYTTRYLSVVKTKGPNELSIGLPEWNGRTNLAIFEFNKPFKWKKPRTIFVCSMGDLFHESVPFEWIDDVFGVMTTNPQHIYLILTKRPERMYDYIEYMNQNIADAGFEGYDPPSFIWLGVTAENQEQADKRIPILLSIPTAKRFVSIEPMLGPVDLTSFNGPVGHGISSINSLTGRHYHWDDGGHWTEYEKLDWIICGSESGPSRRECDKAWIRSIQDQCQEAEVPFLLKQMSINGKLVKMPELDGIVYNQKPES